VDGRVDSPIPVLSQVAENPVISANALKESMFGFVVFPDSHLEMSDLVLGFPVAAEIFCAI
jgi:hypothetical protein